MIWLWYKRCARNIVIYRKSVILRCSFCIEFDISERYILTLLILEPHTLQENHEIKINF